jgi:hypothetical protein
MTFDTDTDADNEIERLTDRVAELEEKLESAEARQGLIGGFAPGEATRIKILQGCELADRIGPAAVDALLNGTAAVVPTSYPDNPELVLQPLWFRDDLMGHEVFGVSLSEIRIDQ